MERVQHRGGVLEFIDDFLVIGEAPAGWGETPPIEVLTLTMRKASSVKRPQTTNLLSATSATGNTTATRDD